MCYFGVAADGDQRLLIVEARSKRLWGLILQVCCYFEPKPQTPDELRQRMRFRLFIFYARAVKNERHKQYAGRVARIIC